MVTTKTENIPLSMKEGSASYFCFVFLFVYTQWDMLRGRLLKRLFFIRLRRRFLIAHIVDRVF